MIQLTNYNPEVIKKLPKIIGFPVAEEQAKTPTPNIEERMAQLPISPPIITNPDVASNPLNNVIADLKYKTKPIISNQPAFPVSQPVNQPIAQPITPSVSQAISRPASLPLTGPLTNDELSLVRRLLNRDVGGALVNKV